MELRWRNLLQSLIISYLKFEIIWSLVSFPFPELFACELWCKSKVFKCAIVVIMASHVEYSVSPKVIMHTDASANGLSY